MKTKRFVPDLYPVRTKERTETMEKNHVVLTNESFALAYHELGVICNQADDLASLLFVVIDRMEQEGEAEDTPKSFALYNYARALRPIALGLSGLSEEAAEARRLVEQPGEAG